MFKGQSCEEQEMPKANQPTKSDLASILEQIGDMAEDSLDPELSREELVRRMKDIADLAENGDSDADDDEDEDDD
jgi:hypothetical protein